ncbi:MAG: hypothetical protein WCC31_02465, partial [Terracidiphilus sp.]
TGHGAIWLEFIQVSHPIHPPSADELGGARKLVAASSESILHRAPCPIFFAFIAKMVGGHSRSRYHVPIFNFS